MKYFIRPFHGPLPVDLAKKLDSFSTSHLDGTWLFEGNLAEFFSKWQRHFLFFPIGEDGGIIYVTQYNNYGAR